MKTNEEDIYILGINCFAHNSSASLIKNGEIIFHLEEERFDRKKYSPYFPIQAIQAGLKIANIKLSDIDRIAFFMQPWQEILGNLWHFIKFLPRSLNLFISPLGGSAELSVFQRFYRFLRIRNEFSKYFPNEKVPKVEFIEHHLAHAGSCFFASRFKESAILIMDGRGEKSSVLLAKGEGNRISKIDEIHIPNSLGHFYAAMTDYLGFHSFYDEWKVMGMGAHGNPIFADEFRKVISMTPAGFQLDLSYFQFHLYGPKKWLSEKFIEKFGPKRLPGSDLTQRHFDLAKSFQIVIEEIGVSLAQKLKEKTRSENLCVAGGVALNILLNSQIIEKSGFTNFFFQPIASDSGTSLGSALYYYYKKFNRERTHFFTSPYLGTSYSDAEIESQLTQYKLKYKPLDQDFASIARFIADGLIIGWYQGRMEAGPRALGNRSILADPTSQTVKDKLNLRIKHREKFRPFAPSVCEEDVHRFFVTPKNQLSPYMIISGFTRPEWASRLPAVTHVDGTARVHTVSRTTNIPYWNLLKEFEKIKGVPILLNTSFNEQEPIVETPQQAIECFLRTKMDVLVIGNFVVENIQ